MRGVLLREAHAAPPRSSAAPARSRGRGCRRRRRRRWRRRKSPSVETCAWREVSSGRRMFSSDHMPAVQQARKSAAPQRPMNPGTAPPGPAPMAGARRAGRRRWSRARRTPPARAASRSQSRCRRQRPGRARSPSEPNTTARVTSPRYFSSCARRAGSTGISARGLEHRAPVAQEEEQHEQHHEEADERAEDARAPRCRPVAAALFSRPARSRSSSPAPARRVTAVFSRTQATDAADEGITGQAVARAPGRRGSRRRAGRSMSRATWPANTTPSTDSGATPRTASAR